VRRLGWPESLPNEADVANNLTCGRGPQLHTIGGSLVGYIVGREEHLATTGFNEGTIILPTTIAIRLRRKSEEPRLTNKETSYTRITL
jgi:hypothetical protein